ncbi:hypothetical protein [Stappia sp.]|uniref:hypothetical protein n=1 Tax=Stappia sp. TaxID=1870903 RepID=UPI0032D981D4
MIAPDAPGWTPLCVETLETGPAAVDAFAAALAGSARPDPVSPRVPATFAFTVLARPAVVDHLERLARERDAVLVHQAQSFAFAEDLERRCRYTVVIDWQQSPKRADRLTLRGRVHRETADPAAEAALQEFQAEIVLFENRREPTATEAGDA